MERAFSPWFQFLRANLGLRPGWYKDAPSALEMLIRARL
jgi:hypothetical protein